MNRTRWLAALTAMAGALVLSNCGAPQPPRSSLFGVSSGWHSSAAALQQAHDAWQTLANNSRPATRAAAANAYNQAVAKLFESLRSDPNSWQVSATRMGTSFPSQTVVGIRLQDIKAIFPASQVNTHLVGFRYTRQGIGLPVVAWMRRDQLDRSRYPFAPKEGVPLALTAILRFDPGKYPEWHFEPPRELGKVKVGARDLDLAADWSAASASFWHMSDLNTLDIRNVFLPEAFHQRTGIYCYAPYDPAKIPVVFVHGLKSSPAAFRKMVNRLTTEPWFRARYQAWYFSYPTGTPWAYNAKIFRDQIHRATDFARAHGSLENWNKMVLVAHSMGGLICHASVSEPDSLLYDAWFKVPFDQLKGSRKSRELVRQTALYQPLSEPKRVIFLAVPHRGAPLADWHFTHLLINLIRLPKWLAVDIVDLTVHNVVRMMPNDRAKPGFLSSISSLSPNNPTYKALEKMPFRTGIHRHSIIGDRGKGDLPNSSDGFVPYWSSHLAPVDSELIIPCDHCVPDHPATADEVARILRLHLKN